MSNAIAVFKHRNGFVISNVIAFAMSDRDFDDLVLFIRRCERCIRAAHFQMLHFANEFETRIAHQHAREKP